MNEKTIKVGDEVVVAGCRFRVVRVKVYPMNHPTIVLEPIESKQTGK